MLLPCQTKFINYINVFWRDCVPAGRIVTCLQQYLENPEFGTTLSNSGTTSESESYFYRATVEPNCNFRHGRSTTSELGPPPPPPPRALRYRANVNRQSRLETRSSILEVFENRASRLEFRGSSFETLGEFFENLSSYINVPSTPKFPYSTIQNPSHNSVIFVVPQTLSIPRHFHPRHQNSKKSPTPNSQIISRLTTKKSQSFSQFPKNLSKNSTFFKQDLITK